MNVAADLASAVPLTSLRNLLLDVRQVDALQEARLQYDYEVYHHAVARRLARALTQLPVSHYDGRAVAPQSHVARYDVPRTGHGRSARHARINARRHNVELERGRDLVHPNALVLARVRGGAHARALAGEKP